MMRYSCMLFVFGMALGLTACRGSTSKEPPVHLNPNMDVQDKYKPYRASTFFDDGRAMRTPPKGTYPIGKLGEKAMDWTVTTRGRATTSAKAFHTGQENGVYVTQPPYAFDLVDLERGRDRYAVYCTPCHGAAGYGNGTVADRSRGKLKPTNFHEVGSECKPATALESERDRLIKSAQASYATAQASTPSPSTPTEAAGAEPPAEAPENSDTTQAEEAPRKDEAPEWRTEAYLGAEGLSRLDAIEGLLADPYGGCTEGSICVANASELPSDPTLLEGQCQRTLGYVYHVITNGVRSMMSYRHQLTAADDRWAVAAYVRALEMSQSSDRNRMVDYLSARQLNPTTTSKMLQQLDSGKAHTLTIKKSLVPAQDAKQ